MKISIRSAFVASLVSLLGVVILTGCQVNPDAGKSQSQLGQTSCVEANKSFSTEGSTKSGLLLIQLPPGIYTHASAEVYFERKTTIFSSKIQTTRAQFLETATGPITSRKYSTSLRCRETENGFSGFSEQAPIISDFTRFKSDAIGFDVATNALFLSFLSETKPTLSVGDGGDVRSAPSGSVVSAISQYWNAGYQFVQRSGEIYEFHGIRTDGGLIVRGKAVFTRTNLPANSQ